MARGKKWPNQEMWRQVAEWRTGGLTYSQICGLLSSPENMKRFGLYEVPSEDTVRRDMQRRKDATGPVRGRWEKEEDSYQAERSGHWPGLRQVAQELTNQLEVPLLQLLGFPWQTSPESNGALMVEIRGEDLKLELEVERHPLFHALQEHLPQNQVWIYLQQWKSAVGYLTQGLHSLCRWVKEQSEVPGERYITVEQLRQESLGLTDYFVKLVVLEVAERLCGLPRAKFEFEVTEARGQDRWLLKRVRNSSSWAECAASNQREEIEDLQKVYASLMERLLGNPEVKGVVEGWSKVVEVRKCLEKELERIQHRARFPGVCGFYLA
jgi:hypothetical protein